MTFDSRETSTYQGQPFELYRWDLGPTTWAQTSGDTARTHEGRSYLPFTLVRSEVDQNGESASGNITVTLDLDNPVAKLFLEGPPSQALSLIVICGQDGESEVACVFTGRVMSAKIEEVCEFTCAPRQAIWKQPIPALIYQSQCPLRWGSARCGVDPSVWRVSGTLSSATALSLTSPAFGALPDGHFKGGWIEAPSGDRGTIIGHVGNTLTLLRPVQGLGAGVAVAAYPGCQGTEEDCSVRYNNLPNHLGFKRIPTRQPFDSGGI